MSRGIEFSQRILGATVEGDRRDHRGKRDHRDLAPALHPVTMLVRLGDASFPVVACVLTGHPSSNAYASLLSLH